MLIVLVFMTREAKKSSFLKSASLQSTPNCIYPLYAALFAPNHKQQKDRELMMHCIKVLRTTLVTTSLLISIIIPAITPTICLGKTHDRVTGPGAAENALGGAASATHTGAFSVFANPAALVPLANNHNTQLGLTIDNNHLKLSSPDLVNIVNTENSAASGTVAGTSMGSDPNINNSNFGIGLGLPLSSIFSFGLGAYLPSNALAKVFTVSDNDSYYLDHNARAQKPEVFTALAIKLPVPAMDLSLGVGVHYSLQVSGDIQTVITRDDAKARMFLEMRPVYTPYLGILYRYRDEFSAGLYYHAEQSAKADVNVNIEFDLSSLATIPFNASSKLIAFFEPATLAAGVGYKINGWGFFLAGERQYWSKYQAPNIAISGDNVQTLNNGNVRREIITLNNSNHLRLGIEKVNTLGKGEGEGGRGRTVLTNFFGLELHQSAMPDNPKSLAIIDSSKKVLALGAKLEGARLNAWFNSWSSAWSNSKHEYYLALGGKLAFIKSEDLQVIKNGEVAQKAHAGGKIFTLIGEFGVKY
ncbi:MAG: hypothetical protein HQK53_03305 [Oligoflexia bacterium]|nr:hypothetical protein [Oligoflexia bacterium]